MSDPTTTKVATIQAVMDQALPGRLESALQLAKLGTMLTPVKVTVASLAAASAVDITAAATKAAATISGLTLAAGQNLPPILSVNALRVTAVGSAATGPRVITDAGGTPVAPSTYAGIATLSDDGKTLTFEGTVTGFILEYSPRAATDLTTALES